MLHNFESKAHNHLWQVAWNLSLFFREFRALISHNSDIRLRTLKPLGAKPVVWDDVAQ